MPFDPKWNILSHASMPKVTVNDREKKSINKPLIRILIWQGTVFWLTKPPPHKSLLHGIFMTAFYRDAGLSSRLTHTRWKFLNENPWKAYNVDAYRTLWNALVVILVIFNIDLDTLCHHSTFHYFSLQFPIEFDLFAIYTGTFHSFVP